MSVESKHVLDCQNNNANSNFFYHYGYLPSMMKMLEKNEKTLFKKHQKKLEKGTLAETESFLPFSSIAPLIQDIPEKKYTPFEHFRDILKSPKYICAPMVHQSELAFRMMVRKYGVQLAYTPMFNSLVFPDNPLYQLRNFSTCPEDRPLVVQFCGNDKQKLLQSAKLVEPYCDAIDINFGCPQGIAKKGNYGAFLMEQPELARSLVSILHENLRIPVWCKMRVFADYNRTLSFAKTLQDAGCSLLAVHGRTVEMKGELTGLADLKMIKQLK